MMTVLHTAGDGFWSDVAQAVTILALAVTYVNDEKDFGELRVYFDKATWDVKSDGLIYTDSQFKRELKEWLTSLGYNSSDVSYSEQGMQGDDYVSLDVGIQFLDTWIKQHGDTSLIFA